MAGDFNSWRFALFGCPDLMSVYICKCQVPCFLLRLSHRVLGLGVWSKSDMRVSCNACGGMPLFEPVNTPSGLNVCVFDGGREPK